MVGNTIIYIYPQNEIISIDTANHFISAWKATNI